MFYKNVISFSPGLIHMANAIKCIKLLVYKKLLCKSMPVSLQVLPSSFNDLTLPDNKNLVRIYNGG